MFGKLFSKKNGQATTENVDATIKEALKAYRSESFPEGIVEPAQSLDITEKKNEVVVSITLPFPCVSELQYLANDLSSVVDKQVNFSVQIDVKPVRTHGMGQIANVIAIASGKGGVGKSTTTVNLAYALMAEGARVGILDADIYGPSIPTMLGCQDHKPESKDGKLMQPIISDGLQAMSIGFLVDDAEAMVWRGPMASSAFGQLLNETDWSDIDYLLIDMPPGTGDIQLTLSQKVPVAGAVVITTPQDIALADAQKGITMFDKVKVPVLGIVENMSYHQCENCGHHSHLFGRDGGKDIAELNDVTLLGNLPLDIAIREHADLGTGIIFDDQTSDLSNQYRRIARNLASRVYYQLDMRSSQTPELISE